MKGLSNWGYGLVLLFFASVPWDISKVLFPPFESGPESSATLTFVRIATVLMVSWGVLRFFQTGPREGMRRFLSTPLIWAVVPLFLAAAISLLGSYQVFESLKEGARLGLFCLLGISIALGICSEWSIEHIFERIYQLIFILATLTAFFALFQYATGLGIWGGGYSGVGIDGEGWRRVNSTFVDPNIFARYLNISILCTVTLLAGKKWNVRWWIIGGLAVQVLALAVTFSRTGWLTLALGLFCILVISLRRHIGRLLIALAVLGGAGFAASFIPAVHERLASFTGLVSLLGQRIPLIQGGWAMFKDHLLTGVGLGNFQWAIENPYSHMLADWSYVTRSHTTLVTIGAEMGLWGILAMMVFLAALLIFCLKNRGKMGIYALANTVGVLVIWLSSQGEGRFFEDPMVWALWGLSLAIQWQEREGTWYGR